MTNKASIMLVSELRFETSWRAPLHRHPDGEELLIVTQGRMDLTLDGQSIQTQAGDALIYRKGQLHQEWNAGSSPLTMFALLFKLEPTDLPLFTQSFDARGRARTLAQWMVELARHESAPREVLDGLLLALLYELGRERAPKPDARLIKTVDYIRQYFKEALTLDDLATIACMSKFHFAHSFKKSFGRTPQQHLREVRLEAARNLVASTNLGLKEIAAAVGYGDAFQLSRAFKAHFGIAPNSIRQRSGGA